ncbi:MAG: hypothetical protein OCD76_22365 [Reichenbachiella sp.]
MKFIYLSLILWGPFLSADAQESPNAILQLKHAVLALPEDFRAEATIFGYDANNDLIILQEGTNAMICVADDPQKEGFNVVGYHDSLEPFMKRGRELRKSGTKQGAIFDIRAKEMESGELSIPMGVTLYVVNGEFDDQGEVKDLYQRFVVYIPYATEATSGLSTSPSYPGGPWIMHPGTHRAHIMINPSPVAN